MFRIYPETGYGHASYRNIAEVLWAKTGAVGIAAFIRRLVFNTLARLPRKLVLSTAIETVERFSDIWKNGKAI